MILPLNSSCNKKKKCKVIVTVQDTLGKALSGATVKLDCSSCPAGPGGSPLQAQEDLTDGAGKASFTFDFEGVLDIRVVAKTGQTANGLVKLVPGKTVEAYVKIAI